MNPVSRLLAGLTLRPQGSTLVVAGFLPIFAIVTMFPVVASMIQHFADDPDARAKVPMMVTAPGLAIAVLAPFAGYAVDRFGRRKLLLWCTFFYGLFGAAPFFLDDLDHIFATRLMLGVCEAGILTIVNTLVGDYWDEQGRRNWIFVQGFLGTLFASGVIMLSGAISALQWNAGFLIYLVAFPILLAMVAFLHEPSGDAAATAVPAGLSSAPARSPFPTAAAAAVAVVTLLSSILYYAFVVNGSIAFAEIGVRDPAAVSRATFIPTLFVMVGAVVFRVCAGRSNVFQLSAFLIVIGAGMAGIGLATTVPQMVAAVVVHQIGTGMAVPTLIAWAQTKFPFEHRGRGMGLWSSAFFLGQFASPIIIHQFAGASGSMRGGFLVAGLVSVIFAIALAILMPVLTRRHAAAIAPSARD